MLVFGCDGLSCLTSLTYVRLGDLRARGDVFSKQTRFSLTFLQFLNRQCLSSSRSFIVFEKMFPPSLSNAHIFMICASFISKFCYLIYILVLSPHLYPSLLYHLYPSSAIQFISNFYSPNSILIRSAIPFISKFCHPIYIKILPSHLYWSSASPFIYTFCQPIYIYVLPAHLYIRPATQVWACTCVCFCIPARYLYPYLAHGTLSAIIPT